MNNQHQRLRLQSHSAVMLPSLSEESMESQDTRLSLLESARSGDSDAWRRLEQLYRPLISGWGRRHSYTPHDAEDLTQEILLAVFRALPKFEHNGRPGAF